MIHVIKAIFWVFMIIPTVLIQFVCIFLAIILWDDRYILEAPDASFINSVIFKKKAK